MKSASKIIDEYMFVFVFVGIGLSICLIVFVIAPYLDQMDYEKDLESFSKINSCFSLTKFDRQVSINHWTWQYKDIENKINQKAGELKC